MQRLFRMSLLVVLLGILAISEGFAQKPQVYVSGRVAPGEVRVFLKDSTYIIHRDYMIGGTLIIEPGTKVLFHPNGRLIDSTGGRIIADGSAAASYRADAGTGLNPLATSNSYYGYADPAYFLANGVVSPTTTRDRTVHADKSHYVFNVLLDTVNRRIVDLPDPGDLSKYELDLKTAAKYNSDLVVVSFEHAIMWQAARLEKDPDTDVNLNVRAWERVNNASNLTFTAQTIQFVGQPVNNYSREWGHIVILPGARAAFFRNVSFENFKKDVTVDRAPFYTSAPWLTTAQLTTLNNRLNHLTNGSGGAITTFSSRTWLIDAKFENNMARHRGGALQILQAPNGYPKANISGLGYYPFDKNPAITDADRSTSSVLEESPIPRIDNIDEPISAFPEPLSDFDRMAYDDARLAVYLGRFRNLEFVNNKAQLAVVDTVTLNGTRFVTDAVGQYLEPASYPMTYGNVAFGGAVYISGEDNQKDRKIEIGFGVNNVINTYDGEIPLYTGTNMDTFIATENTAKNYQNSQFSEGARGGAIYIGEYTSLILSGAFTDNYTYARYFDVSEDPAFPIDYSGAITASYSMGGAIFQANSYGRLQLRGGPNRVDVNETYFTGNRSGAGGAIFVDGNVSTMRSPVIGGSDVYLETRDWGFDVIFRDNHAVAFGGAIYTTRSTSVNGAGGVEAGALLGYGGKYPVKFQDNTAGFAGGAISIVIPNANPPLPAQNRTVQMVRAEFTNNIVGEKYFDNADYRDEARTVRGGGAIYSLQGDLNVIKGVEFRANKTYNGNGGAITMVHPATSSRRFFLTDLDHVMYTPEGLAAEYHSADDVFTKGVADLPADTRMLTRFTDNSAEVDDYILAELSGTGATQVEKGTPTTNKTIFGTYWVDGNTGFAVGTDGLVLKLTAGGTIWQYISIPQEYSTYRLEDVVFTGNGVGYISGDRGLILKSTDAGNTWFALNTGINNKSVNAISFVGTSVGYAVLDGGYVLKTTDAGANWSMMQPTTHNLNGAFFTGVTTGYIVGDNGTLITTNDGGTTWNFPPITGLNTNLHDVFFTTTSNGYAVGDEGAILVTTNGGGAWTFANSGTNNSLFAVNFTSTTTGYIVGQFGEALKTVDGGSNWTDLDTKDANIPNDNTDEYTFYDVNFASQSTGVLVGQVGLLKRTENSGASWMNVTPADKGYRDVVREHPGILLPENGVGLGGALYILDSVNVNRVGRQDTIRFNRVRIQDNMAYTGSAVYSDNYDLKLIFNRSLINGNTAWSEVDQNEEGTSQNVITGPKLNTFNPASSDLAGATIYGEIQGPLPSIMFSEAANSIYNNDARFLIRLPDAPNTKGILAGGTGIGFGGTDTLRGNYWGKTEANIIFQIPSLQGAPELAQMETFWVKGDPSTTWMKYMFPTTADPREQGPFESIGLPFSYTPIPLVNGTTQFEVGPLSLPETLLMSGNVYDLYDKGTDVKTADYSKRRMAPIEDFAIGIPPVLRRFDVDNVPSYGKYVKRYVRDPFIAELTDDEGNLVYPEIASLQTEFMPDINGEFYHPIGYPLYLETAVNYDGLEERSNHDERMINQSVFFVINETTGDYIRANFDQVDEVAPYREVFRRTVELVPDSSRRIANTLIRRTTEGLTNFGSGKFLLEQLIHNAYNEDAGTLQGRKYHADFQQLGKVQNLFNNRPGMPASNFANGLSNTTYFAGERYNALPVDTGDVVRIVSRTVLWREGVIPAYEDGLAFKITESTRPPIFTGDVPNLDTLEIVKIVPSEFPWKDFDTLRITEFADKVFISEDREYPAPNGKYSSLTVFGGSADIAGSQGRDSILNITAIDHNLFYDPLHQAFPEEYSELEYGWEIDANTGLSYWLQVDTLPHTTNGNINLKDGARGYILFKGRPINPFVVPGGEEVRVTARNFPPHWRVIDRMRENGLRQELIDQFVETYPSYMFAGQYDVENARFLQQDTIDYGKTYTRDYAFKIFVTDSLPRFLEFDEAPDPATIPEYADAPYTIDYAATDYLCGVNRNNKIIANVTDKLRFQVDINTDDELEDVAFEGQWDFRYGRTAYGFANIAMYPVDGDTIAVDSVYYDDDDFGQGGNVLVQVRPRWMDNAYVYQGFEYSGNENETVEFGEENDTYLDTYLSDFTAYGKLNIRMPKAVALDRLITQASETGFTYFATDTVFAIAVNDGHGGVAYKKYPVFVNFQPEIVGDVDDQGNLILPDAIEGIDYNPQLLADTRMINVNDPNVDQQHNFELVYADDQRDEVRIDPCFPEAGSVSLATLKTTPEWLKIDSESGKLYGTPSVTDSPANELVTVIVRDEDGLADVKQFRLRVFGVLDNEPELSGGGSIVCYEAGADTIAVVTVKDDDLLRGGETLTFRVLDGNGMPIGGLTTSPTTISDQGPAERIIYVLNTGADLEVGDDGRKVILIEVADSYGNNINRDTLYLQIQKSLPTLFTTELIVTNAIGATEVLQFGTAQGVEVSTGDGTVYPDEDRTGEIDNEYCEFELPPLPPDDIFDVRWTIPTKNGILRNIYPDNKTAEGKQLIYKGTIQAGGVTGGSGALYPVTIKWRPEEVPAVDDNVANPSGSSFYLRDAFSNGNLFSVNMNDIDDRRAISVVETKWDANNDYFQVVINESSIDAFIIYFDYQTSVEDNAGIAESGLVNVSPNPMTNRTEINFNVQEASTVKIEVIDNLGNVVNVLTNAMYSVGEYQITWLGTSDAGEQLANGRYTLRMSTGANTTTLPVVIVK